MEKKVAGVVTVGMFGTCGGSQWRKPFIEDYLKNNIVYFNPVVSNWDNSFADIEAEHMVEDEIILFPVTDETYATGSLAEVGLCIAQAIRNNDERYVIIYIAPKVSEALQTASPDEAKASNRARAISLAHLKKQSCKYPNIYVVDSMEEMQKVSTMLYPAMVLMMKARSLCIGRK